MKNNKKVDMNPSKDEKGIILDELPLTYSEDSDPFVVLNSQNHDLLEKSTDSKQEYKESHSSISSSKPSISHIPPSQQPLHIFTVILIDSNLSIEILRNYLKSLERFQKYRYKRDPGNNLLVILEFSLYSEYISTQEDILKLDLHGNLFKIVDGELENAKSYNDINLADKDSYENKNIKSINPNIALNYNKPQEVRVDRISKSKNENHWIIITAGIGTIIALILIAIKIKRSSTS